MAARSGADMRPPRLAPAAATALFVLALPKVPPTHAFSPSVPSRRLTAAASRPINDPPRRRWSPAPILSTPTGADKREEGAARAAATRQKSQEQSQSSRQRFARTASNATSLDDPCVLTIRGVDYNVTAWARSHPGGEAVLKKFRHRGHQDGGDDDDGAKVAGREERRQRRKPDATAAFEAAGHSEEAIRLLESFRIEPEPSEPSDGAGGASVSPGSLVSPAQQQLPDQAGTDKGVGSAWRRWRGKLFTREDPQSVHKVLGIYALLHFALRVYQMVFGRDPAAGMGSNLGRGASLAGPLCLVPHLALSLSSLIFDTVPRERVVGKPMIWKENRIHSIVFGTRSVLCSALAWVSVRAGHSPAWRATAVWGSAASVLAAMAAADVTTSRLGPSEADSSVATLPFWEGCSAETQRRVKRFYAYTQFAATSTCLAVANPAWPLLMLFPIQLASFLLTLSRKGLISGAAWHVGYGASLVLPFFVAVRTSLYLGSATFVAGLLGTSLLLFQLRCLGVNKYALWAPVIAARVAVGDRFVPYQMW